MIRYINIILFAGMVLMNYLANALPLNNNTTGALSDSYPNLFVPAGVTFAIWGVIYLLLAAWVITQFTAPARELAISVGWLFALSCLLNSLWIVTWHYEKIWLSLIIMVALLVTLILINNGIKGVALSASGADGSSDASLFGGTGSGAGKWAGIIAKAAFGIYLGWICIATIANVTALLVDLGFTGGPIPGQIWAIAMIAIGAVIIIFSIPAFANPWIGVAVVWAFAGIIIKRSGDYPAIATTALIALIAVALITVLKFIKS